ncbi:hypothetical protein SGRIM128S_09247 [Streptomyces griseomycini]
MAAFARSSRPSVPKTARTQGTWLNAHSVSASPRSRDARAAGSAAAHTTSHSPVPSLLRRWCASSPSRSGWPSSCLSATVPLRRSCPPAARRAGSSASSASSASSRAAGSPTTCAGAYPSSRRASSLHPVTKPRSSMVAVAVRTGSPVSRVSSRRSPGGLESRSITAHLTPADARSRSPPGPARPPPSPPASTRGPPSTSAARQERRGRRRRGGGCQAPKPRDCPLPPAGREDGVGCSAARPGPAEGPGGRRRKRNPPSPPGARLCARQP